MDAFYDDFTSPTLDPRWSLMWGTYAPPGLVGDIGLLAEGTPVGKSFDITITAQVGPSTSSGVAIAIVGVDLDFSMEVLWHSSGGTIAARPHGLTTPVVLTDSAAGVQQVTLRRYSGSWAVLADGVELDLPLFGKYFPDESEGDITVGLTVAAGSSMTSVDYRPTSGVVLAQETISEVVAFGEPIKEIYAGPDLVWQAPATFPPFSDSGTFAARTLTQYQWATLWTGPSTPGLYQVRFEVLWAASYPSGQRLELGSMRDFGVTVIEEVRNHIAGAFQLRAFSNRSATNERRIAGGSYSVERVG